MNILLSILIFIGCTVQREEGGLWSATYTKSSVCRETITISSYPEGFTLQVTDDGKTRGYQNIVFRKEGTAIYATSAGRDVAVLYPGGFDLLNSRLNR